VTAYCVRLAEAGVDMVQIYGDLAMQDRLLMKRETWRRFDHPRLARLIRKVKCASPATYVFMHTDGDMTELVPDLIEVGLEVLNPIQPECMDPFEVKERWGDRIVLHGAVSIQKTLPFGTVDEVKREVRGLVERCGRGGGYVLGPTNGITGDAPPENIVAIYEAVHETS
jgi:uroporphyrinogen decarboxylase